MVWTDGGKCSSLGADAPSLINKRSVFFVIIIVIVIVGVYFFHKTF